MVMKLLIQELLLRSRSTLCMYPDHPGPQKNNLQISVHLMKVQCFQKTCILDATLMLAIYLNDTNIKVYFWLNCGTLIKNRRKWLLTFFCTVFVWRFGFLISSNTQHNTSLLNFFTSKEFGKKKKREGNKKKKKHPQLPDGLLPVGSNIEE